MASADLRKELDCSICLNVYTDPVNLTCGHNFCRACIDGVLDTQGKSGGYSCPDCRKDFQDRPGLYRNITLCNIVENFLSTQPDEEKSPVFCTHCVDTAIPAVRSCLHCEASLCDKHLRAHSKSPEHVLCDPTSSLESRKCSVHKKILEYYCSVDGVCICLACRLEGAHHGHQVKMLAVASETKKDNLKTAQQRLMTKQKEAVKRIQSLQEHKKNVEEKAEGEKTRIAAHLEDLKKRVLSEISGQAERVSRSTSDLIQQLETKKEDLTRKIHHIEKLCNMMDPLTMLQEMGTGDLCDTEDGDDEDTDDLHDGGDLDIVGISRILRTGLLDIMREVNRETEEAEDLLLDVNTAGSKLQISDDGKIVTALPTKAKNLLETPKRFQFSLVMSSRSFSSGRHYWEVELAGSVNWDVGVCYPSVDRSWDPQVCYQNPDGGEYKRKLWSLNRKNNYYYYKSDNGQETYVGSQPCNNRIRIYLDYEAGQIYFYELSAPITHIHTFTATFTEPLHAVIGVWDDFGYIKICGEMGGDK